MTSLTSKPSLFDPEDNKDVIVRIMSLKPESRQLWGKMNVGQMMAHVQLGLRAALGDTNDKRNLISYIAGPIARRRLLGDSQFGKNYPTAPQYVVADQREFEKEQAGLISLVKRFTGGPAAVPTHAHPFFGIMKPHEWDWFQWKHLDHHLRQFGV